MSSLGARHGVVLRGVLPRAPPVAGPLRAFDAGRYRVRARVRDRRPSDRARHPGRATGGGCATRSVQALAQAGLADRTGGAGAVPVLVGTGLREQRSVELWCTGGAERDRWTSCTSRRRCAAATGLPHAVTIVNACSASLYALAVGTDLLALDEADTVVVAGTDTLTESMFGLLDRVNAEPPDEVRPFDVDRQGVILGEGAAAVVLEPVGPGPVPGGNRARGAARRGYQLRRLPRHRAAGGRDRPRHARRAPARRRRAGRRRPGAGARHRHAAQRRDRGRGAVRRLRAVPAPAGDGARSR